MKPVSNTQVPGHADPKSKGLEADSGAQQALAEKASNSQASVKARIDSKNMPDKPPLRHQHTPNSSGRP